MALTRSEQMSRIKGKSTTPERLLGLALWRRGHRYRLQYKTPVGRADIVFAGPKVAIFVDGCFWHGCPEHYVRPRSREEFWSAKLIGNVRRDRRQTLQLEASGWIVLRFWEHEVLEQLDATVERVIGVLKAGKSRRRRNWRVVRVDVVDASSDIERQYMQDLRDATKRRQLTRPRHTRKARSRTEGNRTPIV